ncbi:MAG: RDD family protein [Candidatus Izemoplasma sp.]
MKRKVSGERIAAAIIDAIIVFIFVILATIPYLISFGLDGFFDLILGASSDLFDIDNDYANFIVFSILIELFIGILYFVYIPYKMNGQTLGKKMLRIKAINEFGENPSFKQHFVRAVQNWSLYATVPFVLLVHSNYLTYLIIVSILSNLIVLAVIVAFIMMLAREDGKGLHDLIANSLVVKVDYDINKGFIEKVTQMSDWAEVVDTEDQGFDIEDNDEDW